MERQRSFVVSLKHIASVFSAVQRYAISYPHAYLPSDHHYYLRRSVSDLAQVLNVTSSQLCNVSSSVGISMESAPFAEKLECLTSVIQPYRYTSYETSSPLRPTTMLFGCPLPDELNGATLGQRAVSQAFEAILSSAVKMHPRTLYVAICDAYNQRGNDTTLVKYLVMCLRAMSAYATVA